MSHSSSVLTVVKSGRDWLIPSRKMTDEAWELDVYPEEPKVLSLCWSRSNAVCFGIFSATALLAIGRDGTKISVQEMVLR